MNAARPHTDQHDDRRAKPSRAKATRRKSGRFYMTVLVDFNLSERDLLLSWVLKHWSWGKEDGEVGSLSQIPRPKTKGDVVTVVRAHLWEKGDNSSYDAERLPRDWEKHQRSALILADLRTMFGFPEFLAP